MSVRYETYRHIEDPTTFGGLSLKQWILLACTGSLAVLFTLYWHPLPMGPTFALTVFFAGLPVMVSYALQGLDGKVTDTIVALWYWLRAPKHRLPGGGALVEGYVVLRQDDKQRGNRPVNDVEAAREGAWDA